MIISNRRDAGYTIISRFEETFREMLFNYLDNRFSNLYDHIPEGVVKKAIERNNDENFVYQSELFDCIDFPDLKEIMLFHDHYNDLLKGKLEKSDFIKFMDELYLLRCKIAHIKGYFTSIDLDKLIELTSEIATNLSFKNILILIRS